MVSFAGTTAFPGTGYVNGSLFASSSAPISTWTFNASSTNSGYTEGNAIFNDTSSNAVGGTITGSATFNSTSTNAGTVMGSAVFNGSSANTGGVNGTADVYSPVARPLGGTIVGKVTYHNYPGLYFNDMASGGDANGNWNDVNNWWTDAGFTQHSTVIPTLFLAIT